MRAFARRLIRVAARGAASEGARMTICRRFCARSCAPHLTNATSCWLIHPCPQGIRAKVENSRVQMLPDRQLKRTFNLSSGHGSTGTDRRKALKFWWF